jgi:hypothetical protein
MAIKPAFAVAAAALASLAFAAPAQADLQTWRLSATSSQVESGFTAPSFLEVGKGFTIDYVIDTQAPSWGSGVALFLGAVKSFTLNGVTSGSAGYIAAADGLNALNVGPSDARLDGIDFVSFNNFAGGDEADVASALKGFATAVPLGDTELRVDFGYMSIYASPTSFVMTSAVPEPSAAWLLLAGAPLLAIQRRRRSAAA